MQTPAPSSPKPQAASPKLTLIDGSGYIFRAYHALPPLTDPKGTPVGAVYGFLTMLMKLRDNNPSDYMAVIFDAARKTFRNEIYAEYKAHRPPAPDDLIPQFALVREATDALCIPRVEMENFEADDLIATYARLARERGMEVSIVSSDKDLMQLIGEGVRLFDPMKQKAIGPAEVIEKFGVAPEKVCEVLALIGDASDNVPGVPGIGPKTAAELITTYGDVETLLARAAEIKQPKRRETITANSDNARLSRQLVMLDAHVDVPMPLEQFVMCEPDKDKLLAFVTVHGFKTLAARLGAQGVRLEGKSESSTLAPQAPSPKPQTSYELITTAPALERWIAAAREAGHVSFDTETDSLQALSANLIGFSLSTQAGKACYVPVGHVRQEAQGLGLEVDLFNPKPQASSLLPNQISLQSALALLKPLLEDASVLKIGQNIKYDALVLRKYGIRIAPVDDTMLLSYVLAAGLHPHNMDALAERYLGHKTITFDEVTGTGAKRKSFAEVDLEKARDYAAEDADITLRLWQTFKPRVAEEKLLTLYETIERPLIPILADMEARGIKVDAGVLNTLSNDFALKMHALEQDIHALVGQPFNVGSPKQLGEILFEKMQLPGGRKSAKTGAYSTDNEVLETLAEEGHAVATKIIEWRMLSKLRGTYTEALKTQLDAKSRVHTSYSMAIAQTGRLSSSDPNLQNIPIRTTEGKKIRHAFVAEEGCKLISADYSQIELRLLAHMVDIAPLKTAFQHGDDIHAITASQMFGVPVSEVSGDLRRSAKTINFGIIYGISAHGLATRLGIGRSEAAAYIEQYFKQYPGIRDYMEAKKEEARRNGFVTTLYGRRCHLPAINDKNGSFRQFAERQAINAPLQGTAADIIKRAMISIDRAQIADCAMLLQVHDELVFEVRADAAEAAVAKIKPAMERAADLSVPLTVEVGVGRNWGEIH